MVERIVSFDIMSFLLLGIRSGSRLFRPVTATARSILLINGVSKWFLSRASRAGFRITGGKGAGAGSGPVGVVAADATDAAGHRQHKRIFKRMTNQDMEGYRKDINGYSKIMLFGYQYGYDRIALQETLLGYVWIYIYIYGYMWITI